MATSSTSSAAPSPSPVPTSPRLAVLPATTLPCTSSIATTFPREPERSAQHYDRPRIYTHPPFPLCWPVPDGIAISFDEAIKCLELHALVRGYRLYEYARSQDPDLTYFRCHKGRLSSDQEEEEEAPSPSPQQSQDCCPYEVAIESISQGNLFWVRGINDEHNHPPDPSAVGADLCRYERDYIRDSLRINRYVPSWWLCDVTDHLRLKNGIAPLEDGVCEEVIEEELAALDAGARGKRKGGSNNDDQGQPSSRRRKVMWPRHPVQ